MTKFKLSLPSVQRQVLVRSTHVASPSLSSLHCGLFCFPVELKLLSAGAVLFSFAGLCEYLLSALNYLIKIIERMHRMPLEWSASPGT